MKEILSYIDSYLSSINKKYSFLVEAVEFTPKIELVIKELPKNPGKTVGQKLKSKGMDLFWNGKAWLPSDVFNGSLKLVEDKIELNNIDPEKEKILNKALNNISGTLDMDSVIKAYEKSQEEFYKIKDQGKDTSDIEKLMEKSMKGMEDKIKSSIDSREKSLIEISNSLGKDIAKTIKKIILRTETKDKAKNSLEKSLKINRDKKEELEKNKYTPELDPDKKEFDKNDRKFMVGLVKKHHKEGLRGITKQMVKYFNKDLINEVILASRKYGGVPGLLEYFSDYVEKSKNLKKNMPKMDPALEYESLTKYVNNIIPFLRKVRDEDAKGYYNSVFEDLFDTLKIIQKYQRSNKKNPEIEAEIINLLGSDGKLMSKIRKTRLPMVNDLVNLQKEMFNLFKPKETEMTLEEYTQKKDDTGRVPREKNKQDNELLKDLKKMINDAKEDLSDDEKELAKKYRTKFKEKQKEIKDMDLTKEEIRERNKKFKEYKKMLKMDPIEKEQYLKNKQKEDQDKKEWEEYEKEFNEDLKEWVKLTDSEKKKWEEAYGKEYTDELEKVSKQKSKKKDKKKDKKEIDVDQIKRLQEEMKNKKSSYIIESVSKLASKSPNKLVQAELNSILRTLKNYI